VSCAGFAPGSPIEQVFDGVVTEGRADASGRVRVELPGRGTTRVVLRAR
jgi:hypothetical protein